MTMGILNLLLNFLIVGLLMATISYCWVLNRRIKILQDSKSELAHLLKYFDESTTRASESIVALQTASKKIGENIQMRIDKVNYLMDDLAFMIEKGNSVANKLDANFAVQRAKNKVVTENNFDDDFVDVREEISPVIERQAPPKIVEKPVSVKEKSAISLEAVLDRVIGRRPANSNNNTNSKPNTGNRSKAEQELLDMIRSGIKG